MCLALPMQITKIEGNIAQCMTHGVVREVSLTLLEEDMTQVGDFVLIHVGYAIQKISEAEALSTWELIDQMQAENDAHA